MFHQFPHQVVAPAAVAAVGPTKAQYPLAYPNNGERHDTKIQASIFYVIGLVQLVFPRFPNTGEGFCTHSAIPSSP